MCDKITRLRDCPFLEGITMKRIYVNLYCVITLVFMLILPSWSLNCANGNDPVSATWESCTDTIIDTPNGPVTGGTVYTWSKEYCMEDGSGSVSWFYEGSDFFEDSTCDDWQNQ